MEYSFVKAAIKEAITQITGETGSQEPVVVVDYHSWKALKFKDVREASDYLAKYCDLGDWCDRELPFNAEEDTEIVSICYCDGYLKTTKPSRYKEYKFYKRINGVDIYRKKSLVSFEASVSLDVII